MCSQRRKGHSTRMSELETDYLWLRQQTGQRRRSRRFIPVIVIACAGLAGASAWLYSGSSAKTPATTQPTSIATVTPSTNATATKPAAPETADTSPTVATLQAQATPVTAPARRQPTTTA